MGRARGLISRMARGCARSLMNRIARRRVIIDRMARVVTTVAALLATAGLAACGAGAEEPASPAAGANAAGAGSPASGEQAAPTSAGAGSVLTGTLPLLNGEPQSLERYRGDVVLVVNTASECGYTPQFESLEQLYRERRADGFTVLGFPADDVAGQEPRSDEQIAEFCEANFGVSFPMFAKSNVVAEPVNPLFERLAAAAGEPSWNFNKYLVDREGRVVERFDAGVAPDDPALSSRIDELL